MDLERKDLQIGMEKALGCNSLRHWTGAMIGNIVQVPIIKGLARDRGDAGGEDLIEEVHTPPLQVASLAPSPMVG